jgi:predicted hydrocarbon binding protein
MHGIIFNQLRNFAQARLGETGWETLLREARLPARVYLAFQSYPDEEAGAIVGAASKLSGRSVRFLLEDFGEFIVPSLLNIYKAFIQPGWSILDVIEHAERIHERVRRDPHARPPTLECQRIDPSTVRVIYASPRKLCGVGIGFVRGLSSSMGQKVDVRETHCVYNGSSHCEFIVKRMS